MWLWVWEGPLDVSQRASSLVSQGWGPAGREEAEQGGAGQHRSPPPGGRNQAGEKQPQCWRPLAPGPVDVEPRQLRGLGVGGVAAGDVPMAQVCPGFSAFAGKWGLNWDWSLGSFSPALLSADWEGAAPLAVSQRHVILASVRPLAP